MLIKKILVVIILSSVLFNTNAQFSLDKLKNKVNKTSTTGGDTNPVSANTKNDDLPKSEEQKELEKEIEW